MKSRPTLLLSAAFIGLAFVASSVVTGCEDRIAHQPHALTGGGSAAPTPETPKSIPPVQPTCGGGGGSCG